MSGSENAPAEKEGGEQPPQGNDNTGTGENQSAASQGGSGNNNSTGPNSGTNTANSGAAATSAGTASATTSAPAANTFTTSFANFNLGSKKGSVAFMKASARSAGDKTIPVNVNYAQAWLDTLTSKGVDHGYKAVTEVSAEGTGAIAATPLSFPGHEVANIDFREFRNLIKNHQNVGNDPCKAWSDWVHRNNTTMLVVSMLGTPLVMHAINPKRLS